MDYLLPKPLIVHGVRDPHRHISVLFRGNRERELAMCSLQTVASL